jgi:hypothetical protein
VRRFPHKLRESIGTIECLTDHQPDPRNQKKKKPALIEIMQVAVSGKMSTNLAMVEERLGRVMLMILILKGARGQ